MNYTRLNDRMDDIEKAIGKIEVNTELSNKHFETEINSNEAAAIQLRK